MVDGDLFDKLSRLGSILRKKQEPFGGIQVRKFGCGAVVADQPVIKNHVSVGATFFTSGLRKNYIVGMHSLTLVLLLLLFHFQTLSYKQPCNVSR